MNIRKQYANFSAKQIIILAVILICEIILTIGIYVTMAKRAKEIFTNDFISLSKELSSDLEKEIDTNLESLNYINAFFSVTDTISREQFKYFTSNVLSQQKSIQALEWIPTVKYENKNYYELAAKKEGLLEFQIKELIDKNLVPVKRRKMYYPVFYLEPFEGNEKALGFDLGSNPLLQDAIPKASNANSMVLSSRIELVQEKSNEKGILAFSRVVKDNEFKSFILGVFRVGDIIKDALKDMPGELYNLTIYDISANTGNQLLFQKNEDINNDLTDDTKLNIPEEFHYEQIINIADREWLVLFTPSKTYNNSISHSAELILIICIILSFVLFYYLYRNIIEFNKEVTSKGELARNVIQLSELNATKDKLFSIIAHDLKSPFNSMLGFSKILDEEFDKYDTERKKKFISIVNQGLKHTYKLLENLLYWSRSQRGTIDFRPEKINMYLLFKETSELLNQSAENKSIKLINKLPEYIFVDADKDMLSTIIRNLLSNSIKFTPKGGEIKVIAKLIETNNNRDFVEIKIKDNGIGIPKEIQTKLFDIGENTQTKGTENETGTGLGLILCKEFVEKHGGNIWVESEEGKGSDFKFTLPLNKS